MPEFSENISALLIGALGGILLGLAARLGRFCTLGAIEDALYGEDRRGVRMWALALAVAILGAFGLAAAGLLDFSKTLYAAVAWNPLASIVGGLLFGYGMAIAGNCGFGALARLGGGDLRSLVILVVMGVSAYATMLGPLSGLRLALFPVRPAGLGEASLGYAHWAAEALEAPALAPAAAIAIGLSVYALAARDFRRSTRHVVWGVMVGLAIVSGWAGMSWLGEASFEAVRPVSHSFTAPMGELILYLMTSDGGDLSFALGSVAGVLSGAMLGAMLKGETRWEACEDPRELKRQIAGGALMGVGGVLAAGCSVGQGLTAFSTLTFGAPVALAAIFAGAALGLRQLIHGFGRA